MTSHVVLCATHLHNYHDTYVFTCGENQGVLVFDVFSWVSSRSLETRELDYDTYERACLL